MNDKEKLEMYNRIMSNYNTNKNNTSSINNSEDKKTEMYNRIMSNYNSYKNNTNNDLNTNEKKKLTFTNVLEKNKEKFKNALSEHYKSNINKKKEEKVFQKGAFSSLVNSPLSVLNKNIDFTKGAAGLNKEEANYIAKRTGAGVLGGLNGILKSVTTEAQLNMQKGKEENKGIFGNAGKIAESTLNLINPATKPLTGLDAIKQNIDILKDKNSNPIQKIANIANNASTGVVNSIPGKDLFDNTFKLIGNGTPKGSDKLLEEGSNKISEPYNKLKESLLEEGKKYNNITQTIANTGESVGNMIPSIGASMVGGPTAGLMATGLSVKGNTTEEALSKGAKLEEAVKTGNTKGLTEAGTELLSGGVNFFGKGVLDDIVEKGITKKVSNNVGKFLLQHGYDFAGEIGEEVISDIVGTVIDKGTVNPNATYSVEDLGETAVTTMLTTTVLKALGVPMSQIQKSFINNQENDSSNLAQKQKENQNNITNQFEDKTSQNATSQQILKNAQNLNLTNENIDNFDDKYYNNIKNGEVKNIPTDEVLKLQNRMGYRSQEQIDSLKKYIIDNGLENNPIELTRKSDGTIEIEDGNHRLLIAKELGLKEVPVKFVENWENVGLNNNSISDELRSEIGGVYDDNNREGNSSINEENRNKQGSMYNNNGQYQNRGTTEENVDVSTTKSYSNEQTSSNRSEENNRQQLENNVNLKNKAQNYINKSKSKFINDLVSDLQTSKYSNKEILNQSVDEIINEINNNDGKVSKEKADELFENLYTKLIKTDSDYYNQYKELKEDLRKTKLFVPENVANDITDFEEFRKNNRGNLILTNDNSNMNIDSKYRELSETYPELFPADITNQSDQLQKISEVVRDIRKTETNVQAYLDKNMGPDYKMWAKEDFNRILDKFQKDVNMAYRYNADKPQKSNLIIAKEELKEMYDYLPRLRRNYEKVMNAEVLTARDKVQVDRLLKNEITIDELPKGVNKQGIINVFKAKQPLNVMQDAIMEHRKNIRELRIERAKEILGDLSKWKDKKMGWFYSRETASRNIYDIAPEETAKAIVKEYIDPYHINEADAIRLKNKYTNEIKNLKISSHRKYNATFSMQEILDGELQDVVKTKKVSEAELVQIFGEGRITLDQLQETGVDTQKIIKSVETFRKIYNELFDMVNNVLLKNGLEPVQKRANYFPHFTEAEPDGLLSKAAKLAGIDLSGELLPTDIAGKTQNFKPNKKFVGNFLQRSTDITDFNALKGFDRYIQGVTDVIYHTEDIMKFRALSDSIRNFYSTKEIKNKIQNIEESTELTPEEKNEKINEIREQTKEKSNLSNFITWLDNYINILAGKKSINDRASEKELSRKVYKAMGKIEGRIGANMVAGNIGVSFTNLAPLAQASAECSVPNLVKGLYGSMIANGKAIIGKRDTSFASESDFITRRRGTETTHTSNFDKITKPLDIITSSIDDVISEGIVRARYIQNLKNGMTQQEALHEADTYSAGLMADRSKGAMPTQFYSTNPLAKMINMFQIEVNNQYSYYFKDMKRNIQNNTNTKAQMVYKMTKSYAKLLIASYAMNELISTVRGNATRVLPDPIYIVKELIKGLGNDDEDDDWETLMGTTEEILGNTPFVSVPLALFGNAFGLDSENIGRVSISGAVPDVSKIGSALMSDSDSQYKADTVKKELEKPFYNLIFPKAGSQVKKTVQGAEAIAKGGSYTTSKDGEKKLQFNVDNKNPKDVFKALMFGKWSTSGAQNYDSKPLTEKEQREMEEFGLSFEEYKKYQADFTKINQMKSDKNEKGKAISGTASGKKAYAIINNEEYSNKEKEFLINKLNSEDSDKKVTYSQLKKLDNSENTYKYFYGLTAEKQKQFLSDLDKYNFSSKKLAYYYESVNEINNKYSEATKKIKSQNLEEEDEKNKISEINNKKKREIAENLLDSDYNNKQKLYLYSKSYTSSDVEMAQALNINADAFIKVDSQQFSSDKYVNGQTVKNSKLNKVYSYVEGLPNLTVAEKAILIKSQVSSFDKYNSQIIQYVDKQDLSTKEKEKILKNMGFKIKNGRVYD